MAKDQVRIVAYGDSLTAGHYDANAHSGGRIDIRYAPYTEFLQQMVNEHILIDNMSADGLRVGPEGLYEWPDSPAPYIHVVQVIRKQPHACIVLAGTNNLASQEPNEVAEYLFSLYRALSENGVEPIPVTVPPVAEEFKETYGYAIVEIRKKLNKAIRRYAAENNLHCVGLFSATATPDGWMKPEYVNDGLHFNRRGYERMAEVIFEEGVRPYLERRISQK